MSGRLRDRAVAAGYAAAFAAVRALPEPWARGMFDAGARRAHRRGGRGVDRLAFNLRRVVGPDLPEPALQDLVGRALRSYARYYREAFRLPGRTRRQMVDGFHLVNADVLAAAVAAGHGAVVALPHAGNWDAAGAWVAANGWPIITVAERLRPEVVYERFLAFRRGLGMEILPLTGGQRPALEILAEKLRQGYVVPLLADRDLSARGVPVDFFGARTRMPPGPALLALRTGAPLFVADMWYELKRPEGCLHGPLPVPDPASGPLDERVRRLTQQVADRLAAGIAAHPEDWHMLQRMWLDGEAGPAGDGGSGTGPAAGAAPGSAGGSGTGPAGGVVPAEPPAHRP